MGRSTYTCAEIDAIKRLLHEIRRSDPSTQKQLRGRLRRQFDFYITDFSTDGQGFVASDVDQLVRRGTITVVDGTNQDVAVHERDEERPRDRRADPPLSSLTTPVVAPVASVTPVPESFARAELQAAGFVGWKTWDELRACSLSEVPPSAGCYVLYRSSTAPPDFLELSPGGRFKERDPTVAASVLADKWLDGAHVMYIGKADSVRARLRQYARFGVGEPVGHWGGRYIWQLADSAELLIAWRCVEGAESARDYEKRLLKRFAELHGQHRPFANLVG